MSHSKLHIYSPAYHHDHAFIVGDRTALEALRAAIDAALQVGEGTAEAMTADGEGFELKVYCEEENEYWDKATLPYTDVNLCANMDEIGPWNLFVKRKKP